MINKKISSTLHYLLPIKHTFPQWQPEAVRLEQLMIVKKIMSLEVRTTDYHYYKAGPLHHGPTEKL